MIKALRETEQQTGEQLLPKGVADADLTVLQLKEAYSHVGVSLFASEAVKGRNGKANPRLSNNRKWLLGVQRSALGRAMNASAQKFAAMFRRAQRLEQARVGDAKPGDGGNNNNSSTLQAELEETLNRSLGLSEGAVMDATENATENGTIDSTADVNAEEDVSFSIQPTEANNVSSPTNDHQNVVAKSPDAPSIQNLENRGLMPKIRATKSGWNVHDSSGRAAIPFKKQEEATKIRAQVLNQYEQGQMNDARKVLKDPSTNLTGSVTQRPPAILTPEALRDELSYIEDLNTVTAPDVTTQEMMQTALHHGNGETGFADAVQEAKQAMAAALQNGQSAAEVGNAMVQTVATRTINSILAKVSEGRTWLIGALRNAELETGVPLLPDGIADDHLTDQHLLNAYKDAALAFFDLKRPNITKNKATGSTANSFVMNRPQQKIQKANAWRKYIYHLQLGKVLKTEGKIHLLATQGLNNNSDLNKQYKKSIDEVINKIIPPESKVVYEYSRDQRAKLKSAIVPAKQTWVNAAESIHLTPDEFANKLGDYQQVATAEFMLLDQGIKPLHFSEGTLSAEQANAMVKSVKQGFPHLEAAAWDNKFAVWHPEAIKSIMDQDVAHYGSDIKGAIQRAAAKGELNELLGNKVRTRSDADIEVVYHVNGKPVPSANFVSNRIEARQVGEHRRLAIGQVYGKPVTMERYELEDGVRSEESLEEKAASVTKATNRKFESIDKHVPETAAAIEKHLLNIIEEVNVDYFDPFGSKITDIDIRLKDVTIQVKAGHYTHDLVGQMSLSEEITGLPCIGYMPENKKSGFFKSLPNGVLITNDVNQLLNLIKQKSKWTP